MFGLTEAFRSTYIPPDQVDVLTSYIGKLIPNVELLAIHYLSELFKSVKKENLSIAVQTS